MASCNAAWHLPPPWQRLSRAAIARARPMTFSSAIQPIRVAA
ncbi:MAG: hypothetical protein VX793_13205 [Pseudomonadota bacterium]|nr:hypothetical protein [Pseudomonadota bacterium]